MIVKKLKETRCEDAKQLSNDKNYVVYAILLDEKTKFLLEDDDVFSFPFYVLASEVEVVNGAVSGYWKYENPLDRSERFSSRPAMLASEEMLERFFYQNLVNGEENAKKEWELIKEKLDSEML
ncbi:MAG: hypothetical protein COB03_00225 [Alteromonas sp.]|jgi:hypothetical protein|nr:MAG: hypothetical protein COB03_00225 [Alteromonas sp.]|tara:strand:+ start:931 stop:1299 length:369 start_codon:yes stop_codon:yes gene_type:complete